MSSLPLLINFPKIFININNTKYNFYPDKIYNLKNSKNNNELLVAIYNLEETNKYSTIKSRIPYYLSDGHTNGINGRFLLPFMCPQSLNSKECPLNIYNNNTNLIKYNCCNHIDVNKINNQLIENVKNYMNENIYDLYKKYNYMGLSSFIIRFSNILDLIISILGNAKLTYVDIDNNEKMYMPYFINNINKYILYDDDINLKNDNENDIYNKIYNKYSTLSDYDKSKYGSVENYLLRKLISYKSPYRIEIIKFMKKFKLELSKLLENNINIVDKLIDIKTLPILTFEEFNIQEPICTNNKPSEIAEKNYANYSNISNSLHSNILNLLQTIPNDNFIKDYIIKFNYGSSTNLYNLFSNYKIKCSDKQEGGYYNKYLKYKYKYINNKNNKYNLK